MTRNVQAEVPNQRNHDHVTVKKNVTVAFVPYVRTGLSPKEWPSIAVVALDFRKAVLSTWKGRPARWPVTYKPAVAPQFDTRKWKALWKT